MILVLLAKIDLHTHPHFQTKKRHFYLMDQVEKYLFPLFSVDVATLLIFGLTREIHSSILQ